jgi:coenzyme PQQ synthesis protein D (PqqD)
VSAAAKVELGAAYVRSDRIVGRRIADEYVLVPLVGRGAELDAILNLNRVGAFIWERLDGKTIGTEVVRQLVEAFEVDPPRAEADYRAFVAQLLSLNAVRPASGGRGSEIA